MSGLGRTGGFYPGPSRTGGAYPLTRRVLESLQRGRGSAWSAQPGTAVYIENLAIARAIAWDVYEAGQRMANNFTPWGATVNGLLPRWEAIFAIYPLSSDTQGVRQARLAGAWANMVTENRPQDIRDALKAALGPVYVGVTVPPAPADAVVWWPAGATADLPNAQTSTAAVPWYSQVCHASVEVQVPTGWTLQTVYDAIAKIGPILDTDIRAWETWDFWGVDSDDGAAGFYLDSSTNPALPNNLDWDVFDE